MVVSTVPEGYPALPIIATERASQVFDFLARVFGAELVDRYDGPDGRPAYITARVGNSILSLMRTFLDGFGNQWTVATRLEQISKEELHRRSDQVLSGSREHGEAADEG